MATIEIVRNIVVPRDRNHGKRLPTGLELARSVAKHSRVPLTEHEIRILGRQLDALIHRAATLRHSRAPTRHSRESGNPESPPP